MPTDERHEELLRLIAGLTERVYKLEEAAGMRPAEPTPPAGRGSEASRLAPPPAVQKTPLSAESGAEFESRIGGQWLNRLGILAVLIGVSYFLKYAFDNDWVGPAGRVVIGLAGGLAVVFWSEHFRRNGYPVFSYSLKAVGIGILYLSLWASSQLYQLIPAGLAFGAMAAVTAATAALALSQDAQVIAAFAAIGGFMTPIALSTGRNNLAGLFAYTTLLDLGALAVLRYRPWIRVMLGSYVGTLILYAFWHDGYYTTDQFAVTFAWVSSVFAVFALAPFVDRHGRDVNAILLLALANAATYSFEVWDLFDHAGKSRQASAAAVVFGCLFFLMATQLRRRAPAVTTEVHWTIGAALLIVAVPLGFDVPWITIGWFVEGAAIIGVSYRTGNRYLRHLGAITLASGVVRLLAIDNFEVARLILNQRFLTSAVAVAALCYVARTAAARRNTEERRALGLLIVGINVLAVVSLNREVSDAFEGIVRDFAYSALWMMYGAGLMFAGFFKRSRFLRWQALVLIALTVLKVFLYDTSSLDRGYRILSLIGLGTLLLLISFLYQRKRLKAAG